jgi:hypothetical protein
MEEDQPQDLEQEIVIVKNIITGEHGTLIRNIKKTGESVVDYHSDKGLEITLTQNLEIIYP